MQHSGNRRYPYREREQTLSLRFSHLFLHVIKKIVTSDTRVRTEDVTLDLANKCSTQVRAIPRHYTDFVGATLDDRVNYHHVMCDESFCPFLQVDENDCEQYE